MCVSSCDLKESCECGGNRRPQGSQFKTHLRALHMQVTQDLFRLHSSLTISFLFQ